MNQAPALDPNAPPLPVADPAPVNYTDPDRVVDGQEKALVGDWNKRIEGALKRVEKEFKRFEKNRKLMRGLDPTDGSKKMRTNLHFGNMAALLPQVYAKDPEFSAQISASVPSARQALIRKFASTAENAIAKYLVNDAMLKKQAKKSLRSTYTTAVGWWKLSWQENRQKDPLILNQIKDTQDNLDRLKMLRDSLDDPAAAANQELLMAQLQQTLAGLETQQEITIARGLALDFIASEDILIIDDSVRAVSDYIRAGANAHRVWMTPDQFKTRFGYTPKKAKSYSEKDGGISQSEDSNKGCLLCVWEIWSQDDNRIYYVCTGEEGFCEEPRSPDWTGKRWYPFFLLAFNETDGSFYPISDVELTEALVDEYNQNREDFVRDRQGALPINVVRKGGSLTPKDIDAIKNRKGSDIVMVEGVGGAKLTDDMYSGSLSTINPGNYDTAPARNDIEMLVGGGDAARGAVLKAKTATEASILAQGLRGRSAERTDVIEDLLNELGPYALEILLRKVTEQEIKNIWPDAVWPTMSIDEIFNMVTIQVRGGSTGKPDALQEQDRWTKLLPVIKDAIEQVSKLRAAGQDALANAVIELTRETLRRFDERIDIEQFLPPPAEGQDDPAQMKQQLITMQQQLKDAVQAKNDAEDLLEKGYVSAAAQIATSPTPAIAAIAFQQVLDQVRAQENAEMQQAAQPPQLGAPAVSAIPPTPSAPQPPAAPMVSQQPAQLQ